MINFNLPKLPYDYKALLPFFDEKTMQIHYEKHHQGYVKKLKEALLDHEYKANSIEELMEKIDNYDSFVRNNGGGHYNHTLFWETLTPKKGEEPEGDLAKALSGSFGSVSKFINFFTTQAQKLFGSGWTWLYADQEGKLKVLNMPNQDNPLMNKKKYGIPLLGLDLWEHAYYLSYQNRRPDYISAFWHIVDWKKVAERYKSAKKYF